MKILISSYYKAEENHKRNIFRKFEDCILCSFFNFTCLEASIGCAQLKSALTMCISKELQHRLQHFIKTSYTDEITRAKVFKHENLDFDLRWGLHSHRKKNVMHHTTIDQKDRFSNNKNLNCNFSSGKWIH